MFWNRIRRFDQVLYGLIVELPLPMTKEMLEMGPDNRCSLFCDIPHYGLLIIGNSLAFDNADRTLRAGADAGAKAITEKVAYKPGFSPDQLQGSLRAVRDALAASRAFLLIDADDPAFHSRSHVSGFLYWLHLHRQFLIYRHFPVKDPVSHHRDYQGSSRENKRRRLCKDRKTPSEKIIIKKGDSSICATKNFDAIDIQH
jgi:hypothetical protein